MAVQIFIRTAQIIMGQEKLKEEQHTRKKKKITLSQLCNTQIMISVYRLIFFSSFIIARDPHYKNSSFFFLAVFSHTIKIDLILCKKIYLNLCNFIWFFFFIHMKVSCV